MDWPRLIVIVLYALGLVLPVWGAVRAWRRTKRTLSGHTGRVEEYTRLHGEFERETAALNSAGLEPMQRNSRSAAIDAKYREDVAALGDIEFTTYDNIPTLGERAVTKAIRLVAHGNAGSAALVGVGLVSGTVASIAALYLPPA